MAGPKIIPTGMEFWPERASQIAVDEVVRMYEDGFCGAYEEPEEKEKFEEQIRSYGGFVSGADAASAAGWAESGVGLLSIPYVWTLSFFPGCWPGAGQERGDCVSHCERNANLQSYASELADGQPDEVTGKVEEAPEIPEIGLRQGGFASAVFYWYRRHGGDGWSCDASARVAMEEAGLVTMDDHPEIGVDLTRYSGRVAGKYGRTPPSGAVADALDNNLIRQATTLTTREERRDFLANGYGLSTCGSEGWANTRDENGVSRRRGSWAHAMAEIAFDDRDSTKAIYDDSLELILNSWAKWNSGPRDVRDSAKYVEAFIRKLATVKGWSETATLRWAQTQDIVSATTGNFLIPHGSFWVRSSEVNRRRVIAKSSVNGWPKRAISDFGFIGNV